MKKSKKPNGLKRLLGVFMAMLMLTMCGMEAVYAATQVTNLSEVKVEIGTEPFVLETGKQQDIVFNIKNYGIDPVNNVMLSVSSPSLDVSLVSPTDTYNLASNESKSIRLSVKAAAGSGIGTQVIDVRIAYFDPTDSDKYQIMNETLSITAYDTSRPTQAPSEPDDSKPKLALTAPLSFITIAPGEGRVVDLTISNIGNNTASGVLVSAEPSPNFMLSFQNNSNKLSTMSKSSSKTVKLSVTAAKDLEPGTYPITLVILYYSGTTEMSTTATVNMRVMEAAAAAKPEVSMSNFTISSDNIKGGDSFTITADVANKANVQAKSVQVVLDGLSNDGIVRAGSSASSNTIDVGANSSTKMTFNLKASENITTGSYALTFKLLYSDDKGNQYTSEIKYYVAANAAQTVTDKQERANVGISVLAAPTGQYGVGQDFSVSLTLANNGTNTAKDIKVTANPDSALVPKSANIQQILTLAPGASKTLTFKFSATESARSQHYMIGFDVLYANGARNTDGTAQTEAFAQYSGVNIFNPDAEEKDPEETNRSVPKIIVSEYKADPIIVQAGKEFDLFIDFKNTHATKTIYNIKANLTVVESTQNSGNVFTPVDASNTFYVSKIGPGDVAEQYVRMYTVLDAAAKNHIILVKFEYEDEEGNAISATEEIGINVKQVTQYELGDIWIPDMVYAGERVNVYFSVHNTGQVTLRNLKVKLTGENIDAPDSEIIFGNYTSGSHSYYEGVFYGISPGSGEVNIVVSYDDSSGEHYDEIKTYYIEVMEAMQWDNMGGDVGYDDYTEYDEFGNPIDPNAPTGISIWWWIGGGAAVVIIGAVVTVLVVRAKKKGNDFYE